MLQELRWEREEEAAAKKDFYFLVAGIVLGLLITVVLGAVAGLVGFLTGAFFGFMLVAFAIDEGHKHERLRERERRERAQQRSARS